jgi:murein L,D-transpeptidase YcbB/YkuD
MAKPGQIMDGQTIVKTPSAMPVYMAYLTSHATKGGAVKFTEDDYLQNLRLSRLGVR